MEIANTEKRILLFADAEEFLPEPEEQMKVNLKKELNQYIMAGVQFIISTRRTPATLMETFEGIEWKLPVIVMDGAGLYDMKQNEFLLTYQMSPSQARVIREYLDHETEIKYFTNVVENNQMTIYYQTLSNHAQQEIYQSMSHSCYRNYQKLQCPEASNVVYFMLIDKKEEIDFLYQKLMRQEWIRDYKVMKYESTDYAGYYYMKIFQKDASKEKMLDNFLAMYNMEDCVIMSPVKDRKHRI